MPSPAASTAPPELAAASPLSARRLRVALGAAALWGLLISPAFTEVSLLDVLGRTLVVGFVALLTFVLAERWPQRLPRWLPRWTWQILGVAVAIPVTVTLTYLVITRGDAVALPHNPKRMFGLGILIGTGLLFAPWIAAAALMRQRDDAVREQALAFARERSALEQQAEQARLGLLQAQVEPHFLFNTLANVRELVESGAPQAADLLNSLIAYLRAAVPRLHETSSTLGQEVDLVRAYLEVMHMRMPDRLQYSILLDEDARLLQCPPTTLLTLVENAVRHGVDPSENGGRIDVRVRRRGERCLAEVVDSGVGPGATALGLGTGLATLTERLQLAFGGDARLRLTPLLPHGCCAEVEFPARRSDA